MLMTLDYFPLSKCYNFSDQFKKGLLKEKRMMIILDNSKLML